MSQAWNTAAQIQPFKNVSAGARTFSVRLEVISPVWKKLKRHSWQTKIRWRLGHSPELLPGVHHVHLLWRNIPNSLCSFITFAIPWIRMKHFCLLLGAAFNFPTVFHVLPVGQHYRGGTCTWAMHHTVNILISTLRRDKTHVYPSVFQPCGVHFQGSSAGRLRG